MTVSSTSGRDGPIPTVARCRAHDTARVGRPGQFLQVPDVSEALGTTPIGTIAVAVVAVAVAIISQRRIDRQLREDRDDRNEVIAEERRLADKRLANQMRHCDNQILIQLEQPGDQFRELREESGTPSRSPRPTQCS